MSMEVKTKTRFSAYNLMSGLSRAFRVIGWFILCCGVGFSIPFFFQSYGRFKANTWSAYYSEHAFELASRDSLTLVAVLLSLAGCAFLLSVALYTGLSLLVQRRTQIALLERLVRERDQNISTSNAIVLIEHL